jgi:glycosyltransferase involved in cell wall biosynthesis
MPNLFSVAIPTFNEENRIEKVIKNYIKYTDDIIVLDKNSNDKTLEICNFYNVKVVSYKSGIDETDGIKIVNDLAKY